MMIYKKGEDELSVKILITYFSPIQYHNPENVCKSSMPMTMSYTTKSCFLQPPQRDLRDPVVNCFVQHVNKICKVLLWFTIILWKSLRNSIQIYKWPFPLGGILKQEKMSMLPESLLRFCMCYVSRLLEKIKGYGMPVRTGMIFW